MKRTTATFLKRRGEGGMTERYEKSPVFRLGREKGPQNVVARQVVDARSSRISAR